jgi:hypothetical protein
MHTRRTMATLLILVFSLAVFAGCGDDGTPAPDRTADANLKAREGFAMLKETIEDIEEQGIDDPEGPEDLFPEEDYNAIKSKFEQALDADPDNPMAHLGMCLLEMLSINYDTELWELYHDLGAFTDGRRIMNNELRFLGESPKIYLRFFGNSLRTAEDAVTFARIQTLIETCILPRLVGAIERLDYAVALAESDALRFDTGEEEIEIDRGEIYVFRAAMYAVCAGFRMLTVYDMDLTDATGTYDWLDDFVDEDDYWDYENYYTREVGEDNYLHLENWDRASTVNDSIIFAQLKYNLEFRSAFLKFRSSGNSAAVKADILHVIGDIENAVDYIMSEGDDQSDDVIKKIYITELNDDIADHGPDDPAFTQDWNDIYDVIAWLDGLFTQTYELTEYGVTFEVNLGRLFDPGLVDLRDYLPYYSWRDESEWIDCYFDWAWGHRNDDPSRTYSFYYRGVYTTVYDVDFIRWDYFDCDFNPILLLDGSGGDPIDEDEFPYLPDYTFNGAFPDMTRNKLIDLVDAIED